MPNNILALFRPGCVALVLLFAAGPAAAQPATPALAAGQKIGVGSWNMKWLGNTEHRPAQPSAQALADYIRGADVVVIALQEICETTPGTLRNHLLDQTVARLSAGGGAWRYLMFNGQTKRGQNCGVMWNSAVLRAVDETAPWRVPVDRSPSSLNEIKWDRWPHAVQFSAGPGLTDFVVVSVHLKSNIPPQGGGDTAVHRAEEIATLVAQLPGLRSHYRGTLEVEADVLVLGDFNMLNHKEPGAGRLKKAGFTDLNAADLPTETSDGHDPAPFDRVFVPRQQPEFASSGFTVLTAGFTEALSDHRLVRTTLQITKDDDK